MRSLLLAAAACVGIANGEFLVATEPPFPTSMIPTFANSADADKWTTSVVFNAGISFAAYTRGLGSTYQSSLTSMRSELKQFVETASNYTIPAAVTDPATTTTIIGKPDWYDALPSGVKSFKEEEWVQIKSIASGVIAARLTTTKSTGGAMALPTGSAGLQNAGWAVAGAAAAVFF
jgi:hypothetical protein